MPRYRYAAHTQSGERVTGEETASDEATLVRILQGRDLFVARIVMSGSELGRSETTPKKIHEKVLDEDRLYFVREMATLLTSGISFDRALDLVTEQVRSAALSRVLTQVREDVNAGSSFHKALSGHPKEIPSLWSHLVEAGETGGNIAAVLRKIAAQLEQTIALKKKIITALIYPAVLISMTLVAICIFLLFVIPAFSKVFQTMHAKLPLVTRMILSASSGARTWFIPVVVVVSLVIYIFRKYLETPVGIRARDLWLIRAPVIGSVSRDVVLARTSIYLSAVLSSGVGMIYALDIVSRACGNKIYEEALGNVIEDVQDGSSLSRALAKRSVFSPLMVQMVVVGEEGGNLPEMIQKVAEYYEARVDTLVARLGTLVEPVILVVLGVVIGVIVIALMLPIVTISSAIH